MTDQEFAKAVADSIDGEFLAKWGKLSIEWVVLQVAPKIPAGVRSVMLDVADGVSDQEKQFWIDRITAEIDALVKLPIWIEPFDDDFIRPLVEKMFVFLESGLALK